ncbi:hypothetical protein HID58_012502 [Brassica napus]|uniref:Replication factor A C-terminal domain-containing protein n=2 Tax=Brassica TaxID=3705 RepID=A0ABQ8E185_BRANA|nr:hypothetical protein HID58_012502 [Brassica napus]
MANSYTLLANLRAGRCSNTAEVHLLRFWETRNINKGGELMSIEMLLIDEADTLVQGCVSAVHQRKFRERLAKRSVYTLSEFDVTRSNPKFKLSDGPELILRSFRTHEHILELANTSRQLPNVIGEVRAIRSTITDRLPGAQRVMLTLRVESWIATGGSHGLFSSPESILNSKLYLNGTSASRIFFDSETSAGKDRLERRDLWFIIYTRYFGSMYSIPFDAFSVLSSYRLPGGGADETGSSSKVVHAQKIEPLTVADLNEFVLSAEPQIIEFLCTAKVTGIQLDDGWCYIGCSLCSKKLIREESSFTCPSCNETNDVAELKYRVVFSVSDPTGTSSFLRFDKEVAKLTNVLASEAAQIMGIGISAHVDTELPRTLAGIVGNTYTFQLKLTDFNFTANHQTFTISRMFAAPEIAPTPSFAELLAEILARVASSFVEDISHYLTVSRTISSALQDDHVIKRLNLRPQAMNPMLTFYRYQHLMVKAINSNNPAAHYTEGIKQFFAYDNKTVGLLHLKNQLKVPMTMVPISMASLFHAWETLKKEKLSYVPLGGRQADVALIVLGER